MKILHAGTASDVPVLHHFGGAQQRRIRELAFAQVRRGHDVLVYSFGSVDEIVIVNGVEFRFLACTLPSPWRQQEFVFRIARDLAKRGERMDIAHLHSQVEGALLPRRLTKRRVMSFDFVRFRGGRGKPWSPLTRRLLERFDLLLPVSEYCATVASQYWMLPPETLRVLHNGVRLDEFYPRPEALAWRERRGLGMPLVMYVGRLCYQKGTETLIQMVPLLREQVVDVDVVAIGPTEQFGRNGSGSAWPSRMADAGIRWLGALEDAELPVALSAATVLVMPTLADEMFGMAVVEGAACGVPVVASDVGGLRETVPPEIGCRVMPGDPNALAGAVAGLLEDKELRGRLAQQAREFACDFGWDGIAARAEDLYIQALASGGDPE